MDFLSILTMGLQLRKCPLVLQGYTVLVGYFFNLIKDLHINTISGSEYAVLWPYYPQEILSRQGLLDEKSFIAKSSEVGFFD